MCNLFTSFYSKPMGEDNAGSIRGCNQPDVRDPAVWGHLAPCIYNLYTSFYAKCKGEENIVPHKAMNSARC